MRLGPPVKRFLDDNGVQVAVGNPYFDETLKMVVMPVGGSSLDTGERAGRAYVVPTRQNVVTIGIYCRPEAARRVFAEVERSLATLQLTDAARIPENWVEELKSLLKR
jgi:hypothetical protein